MHTASPSVTHKGGDGTAGPSQPPYANVPQFASLSFENAVRLFKQWGFQVEPGPRPEEVTLILEGPDCRSYSVQDAHVLPAMAAAALRARWQNGTLTHSRELQEGNHRSSSPGVAELAL